MVSVFVNNSVFIAFIYNSIPNSADPCIFYLSELHGAEKWDGSARINCGENCGEKR